MRLPCITLWRPWAGWVALGYKTIETRTHRRFAKLAGQRIGIIAANKHDPQALLLADPWWPMPTMLTAEGGVHVQTGLVCTAQVVEHRGLTAPDSRAALIDCGTVERWGLVLEDVRMQHDPSIRGAQGISYEDVEVA